MVGVCSCVYTIKNKTISIQHKWSRQDLEFRVQQSLQNSRKGDLKIKQSLQKMIFFAIRVCRDKHFCQMKFMMNANKYIYICNKYYEKTCFY